MSMRLTAASLGIVVSLCLCAVQRPALAAEHTPRVGAGAAYERPSAEEALDFLRTLPPIARDEKLVQPWAEATADDVRSMTTLQFGGHIEGGAHLHMDGDDWRYVTAFEGVEVANLWEIGGADNRAMVHLGHMSPSLHTLRFEQADEVTAEGVRELRRLTGLKTLMIGWSANIDDDAVAAIGWMSGLEELNISGNPKIKGPGLRFLNRLMLPKLRVLKLSMSALTDDALVNLAGLGVEELDLSKAPGWVKDVEYHITLDGILSLLGDASALTSLRVLTLQNVELSTEQRATLYQLRPYMTLAQ
jgi:hypothetical protein